MVENLFIKHPCRYRESRVIWPRFMLQITADMQNNALSHKCMYAHAIILISDHR